jgi:hypothetical protein
LNSVIDLSRDLALDRLNRLDHGTLGGTVALGCERDLAAQDGLTRRKPMRPGFACCARAAIGFAMIEHPSRPMKSRRFNRLNVICCFAANFLAAVCIAAPAGYRL